MRGRPCTCNSQTEEESEGEKIDRRTRGQPLLSLSLLVINDWETKTEGAPSPATNKLEKCPPFVRLPKTPPTPRSRRRRLVTPRRARAQIWPAAAASIAAEEKAERAWRPGILLRSLPRRYPDCGLWTQSGLINWNFRISRQSLDIYLQVPKYKLKTCNRSITFVNILFP